MSEIAVTIKLSDGLFFDSDMKDLNDGYKELGYEVKEVLLNDLLVNKFKFEKNMIFGGHINATKWILKNLNIKFNDISCYPEILKPYLNRRIYEAEGYVIHNILSYHVGSDIKYFIKPIMNKHFQAKVVQELNDLDSIVGFSKNSKMYISTHIDFCAEYRAYIFDKKLVEVIRYDGDDFSVDYNKKVLNEMLEKLNTTDMPIFYSIDIGIERKSKDTLLVEINDGYALGNYGLKPKDYAFYTSSRWKEITK